MTTKKIEPWKIYIMACLRFNKRPLPIVYKIEEMAYIWLYDTCLNEVWGTPILNREARLSLMESLEGNHQFLKPDVAWAIPYKTISKSINTGVDWEVDLWLQVNKGCVEYLLEQYEQGRKLKPDTLGRMYAIKGKRQVMLDSDGPYYDDEEQEVPFEPTRRVVNEQMHREATA